MGVALGGDGTSGAVGAVAGEAVADAFVSDYIRDTLAGKTYASVEEFEETKAQLKALGVDMSKLSAGIAAAALGKDIDTAASTGGNAAKNNGYEMALAPVVAIPGVGQVVVVFIFFVGVYVIGNTIYHAVNDENSGFALVPEDAQSPTIHITPDQAERLGINVHDGTQTDGIDTSLPGSPSDTDVDTDPITTPENGEGSDSGTVTEDQSGQVDDSGGITQGETPSNQMDQQRKKGQAPSSVTRVDKGKVPGEKNHVHFDDGSAINSDGTWKHGGRQLTNKEKKWLTDNGWKVPNE